MMPSVRKRHGGDAGGVDDAGDAGFAGQAQQVAGAVDVGAVHRIGVANPEAVVGGNVHHCVAALERGREGFGLGEIADDGVAGDAFEIGEIAGFADEQPEFSALIGKGFGDVMAYESGGACEEDFHDVDARSLF